MDRLTKEQRHRNMAAIRGKNTKPEILVRKFLFSRGRRLTDSALPDVQGFVPVRMNNLNGKLNITTASKEIESENGSECEIIYANGVTLRINSAISLEVLKSLILLCQ